MSWFSETYPISASSRGEIFRESTPSSVALPRVGSKMFISTLMVVVFPPRLRQSARTRFLRAPRNSIREARRSARISSKDFLRGSLAAHLLGLSELGPLIFNRLNNVVDIEFQALRLNH